jgi:hypothetical protein
VKQAFAVCLVACVFVACGGDEKKDPLSDLMAGQGGLTPGQFPMPGGGPTGAEAWEQLGNIELTDEMMANYVKLLAKFRDAKGRPEAGLLAAYQLDWRHWVAINAAIARASVATHKPQATATLKRQLELEREKLAAAKPEMKARHEAQVKALEDALERTRASLPDATPQDRQNQAVVQRWMERIQAVQRGK